MPRQISIYEIDVSSVSHIFSFHDRGHRGRIANKFTCKGIRVERRNCKVLHREPHVAGEWRKVEILIPDDEYAKLVIKYNKLLEEEHNERGE